MCKDSQKDYNVCDSVLGGKSDIMTHDTPSGTLC